MLKGRDVRWFLKRDDVVKSNMINMRNNIGKFMNIPEIDEDIGWKKSKIIVGKISKGM